jgi:hypothetical protein
MMGCVFYRDKREAAAIVEAADIGNGEGEEEAA